MSNLIKSSHVIPLEQLKVLQALRQASYQIQHEQPVVPSEEPSPDQATIALRDQILNDAESVAKDKITEADRISGQMLQDAKAQIDSWWEQKRAEDEAQFEASRQSGYEQGYREGAAAAEAELRAAWEHKLSEAAALLEAAYEMREQIIQEAEPFLVDLSCSIAGKIIGTHFNEMPELATQLIVNALSRRREQGVITLCVAPGQLAFVQAARDELQLAIDSQAELQIIPDPKVADHGCVIRSAYGSVDARIDTQLSEIKKELLLLAHQGRDEA
ncbi:FliH/SctL family protein [Paenibacillus protaetiae]|uniref:Flagellar assembly protein FliH n=1 Tax=Paenibacillus protaetiae TaxID=2509456 RepID=A0A4P6ERD4_9BACL|nr:FliH/SctL family protein [Paenibacillus protaetiae]QAY65600.1 flagellar assembly protein FliH [Paenibacillus protaetiae]